MNICKCFNKALTQTERREVQRLQTPTTIQTFLDKLRYNPDGDRNRCPLSVVQDGVAHCFEGAVFAALMLRRLGHPPLIINMFPEPGTDDEHMLAVFRQRGGWGAVAKSNVVGLRFREPIYRTLRELMMSYFEQYYNLARVKTLRTYTRPLNLALFDRNQWPICDEAMISIDERLSQLRPTSLLTPKMIAGLSLMDPLSYRSGLLDSNPAGLFVPGPSRRRKS